MRLDGLVKVLTETPIFRQVVDSLRKQQPVLDQNILRSARPFVAAALARELKRPMLIITGRSDRAYNIVEQLPVWLPDAHLSRFLEPSPAFYERSPWSEEVIRARLETLGLLANWEDDHTPPIVVTSAHALMQKTLPRREFRLGTRNLRVGQQYEPEKLMRLWLELGYDAVTVVAQPGQFSRRGGIIDVFPPSEDLPIRLEFWGDEIESLRQFDPASQRSLEKLESIAFTPMREALPKHAPQVAEQLAAWFAEQPTGDDALSALPDQEALQTGSLFSLLEFYLPWMYSQPASLLDYLPEDTLVLIDDWVWLRDSVEEIEQEALERREEKLRLKTLPPDAPLPYHTWDALLEQLTPLHPLHLGRNENPTADEVIGDLFLPDQRFGGQVRNLLEYLHQLRQKGERVITVTRQAEHLASLWGESSSYILPIYDIPQLDEVGDLAFVEGELGEGWLLQIGRPIHLLTDAEIFGWKRPEPRRRQRPRTTTPEALFADLQVGDYVVHVEHGIGQFGGLIRREFNGEERELLVIEYAENDVLYVPIHQAERLTRYIGADDHIPKLNRLGTQEWLNTRKKASQAAEEIAEELLNLYAAREVANGHAFAPDTPWQHELEASFPYVETEDQLTALRDVKRDMESPRTMDRLICGDVGFGKTEIALRAAFKATMDGKQVAVLVPTTILAQQHYQTFSKRLEPFPVRVEMLSRFRSPEEQAEIIEGLGHGEIDIVIGTHRLLQSDVVFKNLGLVVIDEEQRFGLTHKEQLKVLRNTVDVLTLTATPIPRTLYMSITGLRDISLINTAPEERLPVATHVGIWDGKLIRQAILRELDRGGQVYYVHNRVRTISSIVEQLQNLVPEASIVVGHGQMDEHRLEQVMGEFTAGNYDVLVSTSIVESGLDIPNANTIIVDRADWFGLADLYQLRGRVGRSAAQAYAYFFHPSHHKLSDEARQRLETISEETQLGAGFSIAMRDLEIRGAGDLLGKRQSGHIAAVGFHLYTQLLAQAVHKLKAQRGKPDILPPITTSLTIDLPIAAYIPREYVEDTALRIQLYRRLSELHSLHEVDAIHAELQDRFGTVPPAVEGLLYQLRVKILATYARATAIVHEQSKIGIKLPYLGTVDRYQLQADLGNGVRVSRTAIWLDWADHNPSWMEALLDILEKLQVMPEEVTA
jgi:transcription-repair coupling factor (superfamily II helicase)